MTAHTALRASVPSRGHVAGQRGGACQAGLDAAVPFVRTQPTLSTNERLQIPVFGTVAENMALPRCRAVALKATESP